MNTIFSLPMDIYKNRRLVAKLAKNDFKTRYAGSYLGIVWAFIQPVITILVYWFVFSVGFRSGTGDLGVPFVVAKSMNSLHGRILDKIGADKIIYPEQSMGLRVARNLLSGGYLDVFELSSEFSIAEFAIPESWIGKSLAELAPAGADQVLICFPRRHVRREKHCSGCRCRHTVEKTASRRTRGERYCERKPSGLSFTCNQTTFQNVKTF